ncbi:hypothetical protein [Streptomyces microflavus]|uniref:DUF222 domain-containing protein n=1 Tax=Streptomyces microflavus TaxID=1919 RepID=A0A7H8N0Y5_STRMI|nr:hypothetical protein [Streptomyces microflavus]QKW48137.1 hypothetical protein HUT09_37020 [Streptomyces microflavus]
MSTNKLIAAGQSRLKKAPDSAVDPADPAELQNQPADSPADTSAFAGGRVLGADDVTGTPEQQLAYVTERLTEIDAIGSRAEDFVVLNKAVLLEVAQDRELHKVAGHSNFAQWAGGVLDIEEKYVFELLKDAARIRSVAALGPDLAQHLTKASARKVISNVITQHGVEVARDVMGEGLAKAAEQGKKRPTAALLAQVAGALQIPPQERSEISDVSESTSRPPLVPPELRAVAHAAKELRARVNAPLAPASVAAALAADPAAVRGHLEDLRKELERVSKRLTAAQRAAAQTE